MKATTLFAMAPVDERRPLAPRLPEHRWAGPAQLTAAAAVHAGAGMMLALLMTTAPPTTRSVAIGVRATAENQPITLPRPVFLPSEMPRPGSGGGGGGNRQRGPIRRAEGVGHDSMTLRAQPHIPSIAVGPATLPADDSPLRWPILLDAVPLAAGTLDRLGLPSSGVAFGTSLGPGSGGGVGTGRGTGIGPGEGPGLGPGSGGGTGGGVYQPGNGVSAPRVLVQVNPAYTEAALYHRVQGGVLLELVVTREGRPTRIRVVRSLDPGLDERAMTAAAEWRFEPGRRAGVPVDVLVTLQIDFSIR